MVSRRRQHAEYLASRRLAIVGKVNSKELVQSAKLTVHASLENGCSAVATIFRPLSFTIAAK
jgi:hypothetical protein